MTRNFSRPSWVTCDSCRAGMEPTAPGTVAVELFEPGHGPSEHVRLCSLMCLSLWAAARVAHADSATDDPPHAIPG